MKKLLLILCLLTFANCVYAAQDNDMNFEEEANSNYIQYSQSETNYVEEQVPVNSKQKKERKVRVGNPSRYNSPNSYYNFGTTSGFKGKF